MALRLIFAPQRHFAACHVLPSVIFTDRPGTNVQGEISILHVHERHLSRLLPARRQRQSDIRDYAPILDSITDDPEIDFARD